MEVTLPKAGPMHEGWAIGGALGAVGKREADRWAQDLLPAQVLRCLLPPREFFLSPGRCRSSLPLILFLRPQRLSGPDGRNPPIVPSRDRRTTVRGC